MTRAALLLLIALAVAGQSRAQACTDGTDCFCDCVENTAGTGADSGAYASAACEALGIPIVTDVIACEDFEAAELYLDTGEGNGAPNYGPWYDTTGGFQPSSYGYNQYWYKKWGGGVDQVGHGDPASPRVGDPCETIGGPGNFCFGAPEYVSTYQGNQIDSGGADAWGTNSLSPCVDIMRAGDFAYDDAGAIPEKPDGNPGLYGNQVFANRWLSNTCGFLTDTLVEASDVSGDDEVCYSWAVAYSDNNETALTGASKTIWQSPVKHPEGGVGALASGWPMFGQRSICNATHDPFCHVLWPASGSTLDAFYANVSASVGTAVKGSFTTVIQPANYDATTDWAGKNTWAFVRAKQDGRDGANLTLWSKVTIGAAPEVTLTTYTVNDYATHLAPMYPYNLDFYANGLDTGSGGAALAEPVRIFMDNIVVRASDSCEPLTAAESGFGASGSPTITITGATASDTTPDVSQSFDLEITYTSSDTTGTITCEADLENDGGYEDGSDTGASPQTITGLSYGTSGEKTIGVRCTDESTASDTETETVTINAAPATATKCCRQ